MTGICDDARHDLGTVTVAMTPTTPTTCADRMREHGITLPDPFPSFGSYVMAVRSGRQLFTSGHVPAGDDQFITGKLGLELDLEAGRAAARLAGRSLLATVNAELGDLDQIEQVVSLLVTVNATPDFTEHTQVADGASDVLIAVLGDAGRHPRLAVGVSSLPANVALEVQAVFAIRS